MTVSIIRVVTLGVERTPNPTRTRQVIVEQEVFVESELRKLLPDHALGFQSAYPLKPNTK